MRDRETVDMKLQWDSVNVWTEVVDSVLVGTDPSPNIASI
jgi:hypothetical protein